ncbi:tetratricopeptide repeat protein [Marinomonas epiphytica]
MSHPHKDWHQSAHTIWQNGHQIDAIQTLIAALNQAPNNKPTAYLIQLAYYFFLIQDYRSACTVFDQAYQKAPDNFELIKNYAVCLSRSHQYQAAVELLASLPDGVINKDFLCQDLLASSYRGLKQWTEAKTAGKQSLKLKHDLSLDNHSKHPTFQENNQNTQPPLTPQRPQQDIISFSLWGNQARYLRGALDNLLACQHLYPNWICRFYIDSSVPSEFTKAISALGAQVIHEKDGQSLRQKLSWRFKVANDPKVRLFLVRDTDSVVNLREVSAVNDWLISGKDFHIMRDWWTHTDLILAGMWGGKGGKLPDLTRAINQYQSGMAETPNIDQWFLRDCVWPLVYSNCLIHDRYYDRQFAKPWPTEPPKHSNFHVGQDVFSTQQEEQTKRLQAWINQLPCLQLLKSV